MHTAPVKKVITSAVLLCAVGGCSISPTIDAASWTVGGVSYLLTGKVTMDHAVSAMAGQDCRMVRMMKSEFVCVPRDEDVVGDRMVFSFEKSSPLHESAARPDSGDPLQVSPAIAEIVRPLGQSVRMENRSTAVAAVAADPAPFRAVFADAESAGWTSGVSGPVKTKSPIFRPLPERATRLWLPVE